MNESIDQYKARILSNTEGKESLDIQRQTPASLASLIHGCDLNSLRRSPHPGKWSAVQIIMHLAETEIVASWRYRQMLEQSATNIIPYDQDQWERLGDYANANPQDALELFRLLRERNLQLLARLTPQQWDMYGIHGERGKESVRVLVRMMAGHDVNHLNQVRDILKA